MSEKIKFKHGDAGFFEYHHDGTALVNVMALGALFHTKFYNSDPQKPYLEFATDETGLKKSISEAHDSVDFILRSLATLGEVLVHINHDEFADSMDSLGWLIKGLSDLGAEVEFARNEMNSALHYLQENKSK